MSHFMVEWMNNWVEGASSLLEDLTPCSSLFAFSLDTKPPIPDEISFCCNGVEEDNDYWGENDVFRSHGGETTMLQQPFENEGKWL